MFAERVAGDAVRKGEARQAAGAVGGAEFGRRAGERRGDAGGRDDADGLVVAVGDEDVARRVDGDVVRMNEVRGEAGQCRHRAVGADLADHVVVGVGDVDRAVGGDGEAEWIAE